MTRLVKWLITAAVTLIAFVLCTWLGWVAEILLWPHALESTADRWVVAAAFATVMASAVVAWGSWWAGRDEGPKSEEQSKTHPLLIQDVHADVGGSAYGVQGGNQHVYYHYAPSKELDPPAVWEGNQGGDE